MDINEIQKYLPHRFPFLLIDRVINIVPGESLVAIKNISMNEPFFIGSLPLIMPGVLIVEALAQATAILALKNSGTESVDSRTYYLASIDNARFKKTASPGDQLILRVKLIRVMRHVWKYSGEAMVDGKIIAHANFSGVSSYIHET